MRPARCRCAVCARRTLRVCSLCAAHAAGVQFVRGARCGCAVCARRTLRVCNLCAAHAAGVQFVRGARCGCAVCAGRTVHTCNFCCYILKDLLVYGLERAHVWHNWHNPNTRLFASICIATFLPTCTPHLQKHSKQKRERLSLQRLSRQLKPTRRRLRHLFLDQPLPRAHRFAHKPALPS